MAMHRLPVGRQPFAIEGQDPRREVGNRDLRQDEEAAMIGDQMEALIVQHGGPADLPVACLSADRQTGPAVARSALQRRGLPAQQREPLAAPLGHIAQRLAHHPGEAQVMMLPHQDIPA
jgi:hypothetical protein